MKKTKKKAGEHSSPSTSGKQNLPKKYIDKRIGTGGEGMQNIRQSMQHGYEIKQEYKGLWTNELLGKEVMDYFDFCVDTEMKPSKSGLRLWLGISRSTYYEWENNPSKHSDKSDIMQMANDFMETQYIEKGETHPTMNIFLLKSAHQHSDKQEVEIINNDAVDKNNVNSVIDRLGLDK